MGININTVRLINKELAETWSNIKEWQYNTEDQEWWDYTRHSSDQDFALKIIYRYADELDGDSGLFRIKESDIDFCILWVESRIEAEGNRRRLIDALEKMKEDKNLYFTISW